MDLGNIIIFLLVGLLAGFLSTKVMKGQSYGLLANLIIGVIGSVIGGFALGLLGFSGNGLLAQIVTAFIGSILLLYLIKLIKK